MIRAFLKSKNLFALTRQMRFSTETLKQADPIISKTDTGLPYQKQFQLYEGQKLRIQFDPAPEKIVIHQAADEFKEKLSKEFNGFNEELVKALEAAHKRNRKRHLLGAVLGNIIGYAIGIPTVFFLYKFYPEKNSNDSLFKEEVESFLY